MNSVAANTDGTIQFRKVYSLISETGQWSTYVLLRLRVQNRRTKWNFPLNFRTMRKLSELYSGIFQTQLSG